MFRKKQATVALKSDPSIRRSFISPDELISRPFGDEVRTVGDIFSFIAKKFGKKTACSYREITDIVTETKMVAKPDGSGEDEKKWNFFTLSKPTPVTYDELDQMVDSLVSGLIAIGFSDPSLPIPQKPRVSIYADTSLNWQLMAQAFSRLGHTITTSYTTLGEEGLQLSWDEPEAELCFCGENQVDMVGKVLGKVKRIKWVIYDGEKRVDKSQIETIGRIVSERQGKVLSITDLMDLGKSQPSSRSILDKRPNPEDLFCIMYTSGSTGPPKGVLLTHANMIASVAGAISLWKDHVNPNSDLLLAYLPLAHILEQFLEYTFYLLGVQIGYATVKTLLDDSVRNCQGDFAAYKPTLIGGVPAIYEMIRKGMMKKISEAGPVVGTVFGMAVWGKQSLPWPISSVIDKVLFARVKQATGGRLRYAVCGGGALSRETQLFLSTVLAPIMQGYGLTETCGMTAITTPEYCLPGSVGVLGPSTECKLVDQPELGYTNSNNPPQGEVYIRGPNVFSGYFKHDELNRDSFSPDRWFKTGDIGQWEKDGSLSIIDRVKNLIKLQNGEYLALDKVESIYKYTDVVMMLCISAPGSADRPIAIVYPHEGNLRNHLKAAKIPHDGGPSTWKDNKEIKQYIYDQLINTGKKGGLGKNEMIKSVILSGEEWSPDNGLLTPAMKLNRPAIAKKFETDIKAAYGQ